DRDPDPRPLALRDPGRRRGQGRLRAVRAVRPVASQPAAVALGPPRAHPRDPGPRLHLRPDRLHRRALVQPAVGTRGQRAVRVVHARQLDLGVRAGGALRLAAAQHRDQPRRDGAGDGPRHAHGVRPRAAQLPRAQDLEPGDLPADGHARGRHGRLAARDVRLPRPRQPAGVHHDRHRARDVLPVVRRRDGQGAAHRARPAPRAGGDGPLRQRVADVPAGDPAAGAARHHRGRHAGVLALLRRLHRHELHLGPVGDLPAVRVRRQAQGLPAAALRRRDDHVLRVVRVRRRWRAVAPPSQLLL
ncbi:MAG: Putrescine transport system permease protein PotI, partial [uncultured Nocardioidaceae bacterium]